MSLKRISRKKKVLCLIIPIITLIFGQVINAFANQNYVINTDENLISDDDLRGFLKQATSSLTSLFNNKEGIFLWNIQNPSNLSRYGDLGDRTNTQEVLSNLGYEHWLEGVAQDVAIQYLLIKNNIHTSAQFTGSFEDKAFVRNWVFMTEQIVSWLYYNIAVNDELINALCFLSESSDGFGEFWNVLVRPCENNFINERISLLLDTMELGAKLLELVIFIPYFNQREQSGLLLLAEMVSNWWKAVNQYAIFDPAFAVAGIGKSKIYSLSEKWIGWKAFKELATNGSWTIANVLDDSHREFQNYLYTSPQIADLYLTYIEKAFTDYAYLWNPEIEHFHDIRDQLAIQIIREITGNYADHIDIVHNKTLYVANPLQEKSWIVLNHQFSGWSYIWDKYLINQQGSTRDLQQYQYDASPLKITGLRTYQGAGDIRGLLNIYKLLSHSFHRDLVIQDTEKAAFYILEEILRAQRADGGFVFSPYFGTVLGEEIFPIPLLNDAKIKFPEILPEGINEFTGTMTIIEFLSDSLKDLELLSLEQFAFLEKKVTKALKSAGELLLANIDERTAGIPKQSVVSFPQEPLSLIYHVQELKVNIDLRSVDIQLIEDFLELVMDFNLLESTGYSKVYQWDYLSLLFELYKITNEQRFVNPLQDAFVLFDQDFIEDNQYQILTICGAKDAVAKICFRETFDEEQSCKLCDSTGIYGDYIPYYYREEVFPVTHVFAVETPQRISALLLSTIDDLPPPLDILYNPINQIVILGFIGGVLLSVMVVYIRRPRNQ